MKVAAAGPVLHVPRRDASGIRSALPPGGVRFTRDGRSALAWALRSIEPRVHGRVLVPAYICRSVVTAVEAASYTPVFYAVSRALEPDRNEVEELLDRGADAILAVHYFGLPAPGLGALVECAQSRGVALLEDCAHALFSRDDGRLLGSYGDAAIFSFRKTLALPEGGAAVIRGRQDGPGTRLAAGELAGLGREIAFRVDDVIARASGWSLRARIATKEVAVKRYEHASEERAVRGGEPIGAISGWLARGVEPQRVADARRANFTRLSRALPERDDVRPLITRLPDGASPVGLPVVVSRRDEVRRRLLIEGIGVRVFWEELPAGVDPGEAAELRDRMLVLPVHQDLSAGQVDHVADVFARAVRLPHGARA